MSGDEIAARIVAEALDWLGTPYRHQGARKGVGCDCLGLVRGVWQGVYGVPAATPGPYGADWADKSGEDRLMAAAHLYCREKPAGDMGGGDLLLFRWRAGAHARHCGILVAQHRFIHAYDRHAVTVSALVPSWRRRIAGVFAFPAPGEIGRIAASE